ncbi:MAG: hypothetical protein AAB320_07205 [Elusimicrobiota bacterium]
MSRRWALWLGLAGLLVWHLALRRHGFALPMIVDEGEYACAARAWLSGGLPYRDSFSQKPPMTLWLYRAAYTARPSDILAPRRLALVFSWLTMLCLLLLTPKAWRWEARLAAPAVYGVLSTSPIGTLGFAANTEVFLCLFTTASALALRQGWVVAAGLAAGAALMTKQTALWTVVVFAVLAYGSSKDKRKAAGLFLTGAALVPLLWLIYFWKAGALQSFLSQVFLRNAAYAAVVSETSSLGSQLGWFAGTVAPLFAIGDWPAWALAFWGLKGGKASWTSPETLATAWLGAALVGAFMGLFLFPYYFLQAFPALALAAAAGLQKLKGRTAIAAFALLCLWPAGVRGAAYFWDPPELTAKKLLYPNPLFESLPLADYIRTHSSPTDNIYIYGSEAQIYLYAQRAPATIHVLSYALTLFPESEKAVADELAAIKGARPKFVVYSAQPGSTIISSKLGLSFQERVRAFLARDYRWIGQVDVLAGPSQYRFEPKGLGAAPDWNSEASLFLFERR